MKVGFDISQIAHKGGVATYTQNLSENLVNIADLEMVFFYSSLRKPYSGNIKKVRNFRLPPTLFEILFNRLRNIPIERFIGQVDIFHSSDWVQPPTRAKKVTTYHDVIPLKFPQWSHPKVIEVHKRRLKIVEKEIDIVIAVTNTTKKDLMEISNLSEDKIKVVYEGVSPIFKKQKQDDINKFREKYNLPDKFLLAIGGVGERRNLKIISEAATQLPLIITGESIPWLPDDEMPLLYSSAEVLLYLSFYEGFGLPILEAFASELPVITSNVSSMPEIGSEGALYVDPFNLNDIKEKIDQLLNDKKLQIGLIKKGLVRVKDFSWQKCAQETAEIYKELVNET